MRILFVYKIARLVCGKYGAMVVGTWHTHTHTHKLFLSKKPKVCAPTTPKVNTRTPGRRSVQPTRSGQQNSSLIFPHKDRELGISVQPLQNLVRGLLQPLCYDTLVQTLLKEVRCLMIQSKLVHTFQSLVQYQTRLVR